MLFLSVFLIFISFLLFIYLVLLIINKTSLEMNDRITSIEMIDKSWKNYEDSYGDSVLSAIFKGFGSALIKLTPSYKSDKLRKLLEKAGILRETSFEKYVARKVIITLVIMVLVIALTMYLTESITYSVVFVIFSALIVNMAYRFYISKKVTKRGVDIVKSLPFTLDLITVSVEAGLSLDGAIGRIVGAIEGPLSDEFGQTLKEIRMGIEKKDALKNMTKRVDIKDVSMLLSSLIQADELGVSLGKILRIEGAQLREKRKQAAREKAMKAPVKMLFPLMIFIFPTIFVIVLGPAAIKIMDIF